MRPALITISRWLGRQRASAVLIAALLVGGLATVYDAGRNVYHVLQQGRDALHPRRATGDVVVVEIDAKSLMQINHWPWPRSIHGRLVDRLRAAPARAIAFDVDLSSPSVPWEDKSFEQALARAGGSVILPTFRQYQTSDRTQVFENLPIPALRDHSFLASVNIVPDEDGLVRRYETGVVTAHEVHPSIPALLAETSNLGIKDYAIDQSIDPRSIPQYSIADVVNGRVPKDAFKGKRVLIGATAIEMGDRYALPNFGVLPGVIVQALATETLLQGTAYPDFGPLPLLLCALLALILAQRKASNMARGLRVGAGLVAVLALPLPLEIAKLCTLDSAPALAALTTGAVLMLIGAIHNAFVVSLATDHDTGLPNLVALRRDCRAENTYTIVVARIHHYGEIALLLGSEQTATALQRIADRLLLATANRTIYRVEDNALAWQSGDASTEELSDRFAALAAIFRSPLLIGGRPLDVSLSFGVAAGDAGDPRVASAQALLAADRAADQGILWDVHSAAHGAEIDWKMSLLSEVDKALANSEMWVAYQPKADANSGAIIGAEALVRWLHPERGPIAPDHFIPLIEKEGRIAELTLFVVARAIADLQDLSQKGFPQSIAVNISASLLHNLPFQKRLSTLIKKARIDPARLVFEITESATFDNPDQAIDAMRAMRALGVSLSIDDYGTGQSTLTYLKRLPASEIKIDKSFILDLTKSRNDQILVRSTIALAHELGFKVVAEGVEHAECLALLRTYGCDVAQGWHIGRPMPIDELAALLETPTALAA